MWTTWLAAIFIIFLVIFFMWSLVTVDPCISRYSPLTQKFPDPTNRMIRCRPIPFESFYCETLGLKKVECSDYDVEGRKSYCCTEDSPEAYRVACSVPY